MSVSGKSKHEWVAVTLCDFGTPGRRESIRNHFTMEAAYRAFNDLCKVYGREGWRCWQETRDGDLVNEKIVEEK